MSLHDIDVGSIPTGATRKCELCGGDLSQSATAKTRFCSRDCSTKSRRKTRICEWCRKEYWKPSTRHSMGKFCSPTCQYDYRYENVLVPKLESGEIQDLYGSKYVRRYLSERDGPDCVECGQPPEHNNAPLTLQIDHIDGNSDNNDLINLRLLCPNCHTQTDTYGTKGGTNKKTRRNKYLRAYKASNAKAA